MSFLTLNIECLEDIKVTTALNQTSSTESLSYISGSAIRGAFISNYIKIKKVEDILENEESKKWFFNNGLEFMNAYIENSGSRTYPTPQGLYGDSLSSQEYFNGESVRVKNQINTNILDTDKKFNTCEFIDIKMLLDSNKIEGVNVSKLYNLHIRKDTKRDMFRYEAIEKGQVFKAIIKTNNLTEDEIEAVKRVLTEGEFYIGGSRGSGYGKVKITKIKVVDTNPEMLSVKEIFNNSFVVYTTSDGIYLDGSGNQLSCIDEKWLEEMLEVKNVKLVDGSIDEILVGGYNKKWTVRIPQYTAVKKGSIFKYTFEGSISEEKLNNLQEVAFGLRTEEGFGRFIILPSLNIEYINKSSDKEEGQKEKRFKFTDEEKEQVKLIVNSLARKKIESKIKEIIVTNCERVGKVKNNQIGKLVQLFSQCQQMRKEEGIKYINNYLNHLTHTGDKERINQQALNQLKDLKLNGKRTIDFIKSEIEELNKKEFLRNYGANLVNVGGVKPEFSDEEIYVYKMVELENTFRYILRSK